MRKALAERTVIALEKRGWTVTQAAARAGIETRTLYRMIEGAVVSMKTLRAFAQAIGEDENEWLHMGRPELDSFAIKLSPEPDTVQVPIRARLQGGQFIMADGSESVLVSESEARRADGAIVIGEDSPRLVPEFVAGDAILYVDLGATSCASMKPNWRVFARYQGELDIRVFVGKVKGGYAFAPVNPLLPSERVTFAGGDVEILGRVTANHRNYD